ncbi:MAG: HWE histidine kinase domain-containing protein [Micropepsaceae bacterium]
MAERTRVGIPARVWLAALALGCALPVFALSALLFVFQIERHGDALWRDDLIYFGLPALFVLILTVLLAWILGGGIADAMRAVAASSQALAKGEKPVRVFSRIGEINDIQDALARAAATLAENRAARAAVLSDLKAADARQHVLIGELDHRAKNMLAAVHAIARRSLPAGDATDHLTGRLVALTRAHNALAATAWRGAHLLQLIEAEAAPFEGQVTLQGRDVLLNAKAAQAIALIFHELMMNAVKYGALSVEAGRVSIAWHVVPGEPPRVVFTWTETGGPAVAPPTRRGFGRMLIERSASLELNGDAALDFAPGGVRCEIAVPLYEMEATALEKFELDAVAVAPGAAARPAPAGPGPKRILVVEDEGMVALDIVNTLEDAGYAVAGPAGRLAAALELARTALLDAAVLDANLAGQPVFAVADELARRNVPFVFSSGYSDSSHFPPAYKTAPRIQKPFQRDDLLRAIASVLPPLR